MNRKKIILSAVTLVVVAGLAIGGTLAFYSDTETSEGNILTAGSIDLKVDHTRQTYNGVDCQTCDVTIVSNTNDFVVERDAFAEVVEPTSVTNQYWTADVGEPSAEWIWADSEVTEHDSDNTVTYTFKKEFSWFGPLTGATLELAVAADNQYEVILNGNSIHTDTNENNHSVADNISLNEGDFVQGVNTLEIKVTNLAQPDLPPLNNPGGLLYRLHIDGNCEDEYFISQCKLWEEKDLDEGDTFFNFDDIKPGDFGTNMISLHVSDNDAWACLIAHDGVDDENTVYEPELPDTDENGELQNYLEIFTWLDDGDGEYENDEEPLTDEEGTLVGAADALASLDSATDGISATTTAYIGLAWCAGDIDATGGSITCDGAGMKNDAQSDSYTAKLTAYAVQKRNNDDFSCSSVDLEETN